VIIGGSVAALALAAIAFYAHLNEVLSFVCSGVAIALLAALVGRCVERLGDRLGAGATGVLQSALGNLPELFISFFALRAGRLTVVQSALIGSILANLLLVLGAAFLVGGLKHGTQRFDHGRARTTAVLLALATAALVLPSLAAQLHSPAGAHETQLSVAVAIILLAIFALSLPASLRRQAEPVMGRSLAVEQHPSPVGTDGGSAQQSSADGPPPYEATGGHGRGRVEGHAAGHWPIWLATALLALAGVAAGLVSDWFVDALQRAIDALHISPAFAGLVIVAIAGNAVENVVGIQLAARNQADYAVSVIVNSPIQIALVLAPALVLLSFLTATTLRSSSRHCLSRPWWLR
jgi:Ca2+:H+ antiporter